MKRKGMFYLSFFQSFVIFIAASLQSYATDFPPANAEIMPIVSTLKKKMPHWHMQTAEYYPSGSPKYIILYELQEGIKIPVKLMALNQSGALSNETDLIVVSEKHPEAKTSGTRVLLHGPSMSYSNKGTIEQIAFYNEGKLHGPVKTYWENGLIKSKYSFYQGILHGPCVIQYLNGNVQEKGYFNKGQPTDEWQMLHLNGNKASIASFQHGVKHGQEKEWDENGSLKAVYHYTMGLLNDPKQGESAVTQYHPGNKIAKTQSFTFGKLNNSNAELAIVDKSETAEKANIEYYPDDVKKTEYYKNALGELQGNYLEWYPNELVKRKYTYKDGLLNGLQEEFQSDGTPLLRCEYVNNMKHGVYEEWHENGLLALRCCFDNGLKDGLLQAWHENNQQAIESAWSKGILSGPLKEWYPNGQTKKIIDVENGSLNGFHREWNDNGKLVLEIPYQNDVIHGLAQEWFSNGSICKQTEFNNGKVHGKQESFHPIGSRAFLGTWVEDKPHGDHISWYEDGAIAYEKHFNNGVPIGIHREFFPQQDENLKQQIKRIVSYNDHGKLDGEQNIYHLNGLQEALLSYRDGILHGKKALWNDSGILLEEGNYIEGNAEGRFYQRKSDGKEYIYHYAKNQLNGPHQVWYPEHSFFGKIKALEGCFNDGLLEGEVTEFNEAGTKVSSTYYKNGLKDGIATIWAHDGKIRLSAEFKNDNQNGMAYEYFPNGNIFREVFFVDDLRQGNEKMFFDNGKLAGIRPYKDGLLHGLAQEWSQKGFLVYEAEWVHGKRHGVFNKYDETGSPALRQRFENDSLVEKWKVPSTPDDSLIADN